MPHCNYFKIMSIIVQRDGTIQSFIIFMQTALHVSGDTLPIIRNIRKQQLQHLALVKPCLLPSVVVEESEPDPDSSTSADGSKYISTSARCCNYSLNVLLMTDEGITRNMQSLIFVVPCIMLNSEINPTRCNNCVYSSQWLYSTCFG